MQATIHVSCPHCGEFFETVADSENQDYVEDCYVCCQPIVFHLFRDTDGEITGATTYREND